MPNRRRRSGRDTIDRRGIRPCPLCLCGASVVKEGCGFAKIRDECGMGFVAALVIGSAQDRRWVDGGEYRRQAGHSQHLAAILGDAKGTAEERLGGGGAETDDQFGLNRVHFCFEPRAAGAAW